MSTNQSPVSLVKYWRGLSKCQKDELAAGVGTSPGYLRQVFLYGKQAGSVMARQLGELTDLSAADFRPDIFSGLAVESSIEAGSAGSTVESGE